MRERRNQPAFPIRLRRQPVTEQTSRVTPPRFVTLDQDGIDHGWLGIVVEARTGVRYQWQYGGHVCRQGQAEGFLVPLFRPDALDALRRLFEVDFGGAGTWNYAWPENHRARLRGIIGAIPYCVTDGNSEQQHALVLDEDPNRIRDTDEACVPVLTPDGPGLLVWSNSD
jgi:hypothetical protein